MPSGSQQERLSYKTIIITFFFGYILNYTGIVEVMFGSIRNNFFHLSLEKNGWTEQSSDFTSTILIAHRRTFEFFFPFQDCGILLLRILEACKIREMCSISSFEIAVWCFQKLPWFSQERCFPRQKVSFQPHWPPKSSERFEETEYVIVRYFCMQVFRYIIKTCPPAPSPHHTPKPIFSLFINLSLTYDFDMHSKTKRSNKMMRQRFGSFGRLPYAENIQHFETMLPSGGCPVQIHTMYGAWPVLSWYNMSPFPCWWPSSIFSWSSSPITVKSAIVPRLRNDSAYLCTNIIWFHRG